MELSEKYFNVAGPCNPAKHYMIPATERLPDLAMLLRREQYFMIHAARQSGKTWEERIYNRDVEIHGKTIHVVGL